MSKVLREIILSLRNKHANKYKYDFQNSLLSGALLPTGNIHKSAHTSCTVNLKKLYLGSSYTDSHEQCSRVNVFSSCSENHRMLMTKCVFFLRSHQVNLTQCTAPKVQVICLQAFSDHLIALPAEWLYQRTPS